MKNHTYIGVMSGDLNNNEIKFVYKVADKVAYWKTWKELRDEKIKAFNFKSITSAEQIVFGLSLNGYVAFVVRSPIEIK